MSTASATSLGPLAASQTESPPDQLCDSAVAPVAPCEAAALTDAELVCQAQAGDSDAFEVLLQRHLPLFRRRAEQVCGDALGADSEDLCQEACIKAMSNIRRLRNGDVFCAWVLAFIKNEARNWKRQSKKSGTSTEELTLREIESMSVKPPSHSAADMAYLLSLLRRQARRAGQPCRRTAAFMLKYYTQEQKFPPVRTIAEATQSSQGTAQRYREAILVAWRRTLTAFDLKP